MSTLFLLIMAALLLLSVSSCQVMDVSYKISTLITGVGCNGKLEQTKNGDLYFADTDNSYVYKYSQSGNLIKLVGTGANGFEARYVDGLLGPQTPLNNPRGVSISPSGEIYISEWKRIRVLFTNNTVGTILTTFLPGYPHYFENEIYFLAGHWVVKKVNLNSKIDSVVFGDSSLNENSTDSQLRNVQTMFMESDTGDIYFGDSARIGKFEKSTNTMKAIAGYRYRLKYGFRGLIGEALIGLPRGISVASNGDIIFSDGNRIRKISFSTNKVSIIAGTGKDGSAIDGVDATMSPLNSPKGVLINSEGIIYFSDYGNDRIRMLTPYCSDSNYQLVKGLSCVIKN